MGKPKIIADVEEIGTKVGNLTAQGIPEPDLATAIKNDRSKNKRNNTIIVSKEGTYSTINDAITYIKTQNVSITNRWTIIIATGIYNEKITLTDGIDLIGQNKNNTIITYSGKGFRTDDTIYSPFDCSISNLTIIQDSTACTTDVQNYCLHADDGSGTHPYTLNLNNCIFKCIGEFCHHACGFGLANDQYLYIDSCEFHSDSKPSLFIHNWNNTSAMKVDVKNSKIYSCKIRDKVSLNYGLLVEDVGSSIIEEIKIYNTEIATLTNGGYDVGLMKHTAFSGVRNTIYIQLINCKYNNYFNETDSGKIITDKDIPCRFWGSVLDYGKPIVVTDISVNIPFVSMITNDDLASVVGVIVPYYTTTYGYIRTQGVVDVQVDATVAITKGDFLSSKANNYAKKGTVGNGNCFAIALEPLASGTGFIKAMLISPR